VSERVIVCVCVCVCVLMHTDALKAFISHKAQLTELAGQREGHSVRRPLAVADAAVNLQDAEGLVAVRKAQ
jgi:hypothetical protein